MEKVNSITLSATKRTVVGKKVKQLRRKEQLPAVVYGRKLEPEPLTIETKHFEKVFQIAGTSSLVNLSVDEKSKRKVLIHEPQCHPVTGRPIHVDLYAVRMDEKIETEVPLKFVGQSAAVEDQGGNFIVNIDSLHVRCLPADLVSEIEVDISVLANLEDQLRLSDIKLPERMEVLDDPDEVVALVEAPRTEEELEEELAEDKSTEEAAVEKLSKEVTEEPTANSQASDDSSDRSPSE